MEFAVLFILAFIVGWVIYRFTYQWLTAVMVPMMLFLLSTVTDHAAREAWAFTLIFGLPLVFFASLLGAYIVQIRNLDDDESLAQKELDE
jgi:hypothetical protein